MKELVLAAGGYVLGLSPERGGSVSRFEWRGESLFRATCGPSIFDTACFPLVPFSNRIAHGRFYDADRAVVLARNFPGRDHPHPIHGFGWLAAWELAEAGGDRAVLRHHHPAGEWPWSYRAEQHFRLTPAGLELVLNVTNLSDTPMPAGLGIHPYFDCDEETTFEGLHRWEWQTDAEGLPRERRDAGRAIDWWDGAPVGSRLVDTAYQERDGALTIRWPCRNLTLRMRPSAALDVTVVYTPEGLGVFCVEPVSHPTDAINRRAPDDGLQWLAAGEVFEASIGFEAFAGI